MSLKAELKSIILYEIEHVFGRRVVSSRDCIELSEDVFRKTTCQLNPNTLRRFFNIIKAEYPPSQSTLIILSKYCGFQNLDDIYRIKKNETAASGAIQPESMLNYLVGMFQDSIVTNRHDDTFLQIVIHSIKFINANKFLSDRFQSLIAKTNNGINYYFEQLVNIDKLNSFYGSGLRYYLREKGTVEAEIFTTSLHVFKYWLNGEDVKLANSAEIMISCDPLKPVHPYLEARQMAALLFYYNVIKADTENLRISISNFLSDLDQSPSRKKYLYYATYILAEALLLTGFAGDTLFYIKLIKKNTGHILFESDLLNYSQNYNLLEAYALLNIGETKQAEKKFNDIKSSEFPFLNKKFSSILYLSMQQRLKPRDKKNADQLKLLIHETGFERMYSLMPVNKFGTSM